jgi:hypothetical protein
VNAKQAPVVGTILPQGAVALALGLCHYLEFKYGKKIDTMPVFGKHPNTDTMSAPIKFLEFTQTRTNAATPMVTSGGKLNYSIFIHLRVSAME